jgi:hypothetical protein
VERTHLSTHCASASPQSTAAIFEQASAQSSVEGPLVPPDWQPPLQAAQSNSQRRRFERGFNSKAVTRAEL